MGNKRCAKDGLVGSHHLRRDSAACKNRFGLYIGQRTRRTVDMDCFGRGRYNTLVEHDLIPANRLDSPKPNNIFYAPQLFDFGF